jgi:hypothetical protein
MNNPQLTQIEKMLTALLKSNNQLHWIGGYVYGRTTPRDDQRIGDPFIILYPASERLNHKVTRVYEHDFPKLPAFLDTHVPESGTVDDNPDRDKALRKRVYHPCEHFLITTYEGKETQMGPEVRFLDVIRTAKPKADATPAPAPQPSPVPTSPKPVPVQSTGKGAPLAAPLKVVPPPTAPINHWCEWCGDRPSVPGVPCGACEQLGATPENKPAHRTAPAPSPAPTVPELTERQKQLRALYDYAKGKGMSKGAVDLELAQYHGNPVDTLQALQAEHGDRQDPPAHPTITISQYWHDAYNTTPKWSRDGAQALLNECRGNVSLAHQEMMTKKQAAVPAQRPNA